MAFIGSTTAYPTVTPAGADLVPIVRDSTGEVATATVANLIGSASEPTVALTGTSHSMLASYRSKLVTFSNASAVAASLPQAGVTFPDGWFFDVKNIGVGTVTITPTTSTIDGAASIALATGQSCRIVSDGTNYRTVLRSNGSPVPVADGGTGRTSHTAYAVLCGGTSSTAAQQSIASVGTAGQVLTSNGAGALPTFQAPSGGTVDSDDVTYTPTTLADWDGSADPGDVEQALDQLAERVTDLEAAGGGGTAGKHAIYIAAGSMRPSATGGCAALAGIASAANQPDIVTLDFDASTQEYAQFGVRMPKSWNEGTVTFVPIWSHAATSTNFGVVWDLQAVAVSDDDAIAVAFGTAQTSTDTGGTTNDVYIGPESSAITVAGTPAAEDMVFFRISRVTGNGSDTMAIDARLHGITLYITTDAENDA